MELETPRAASQMKTGLEMRRMRVCACDVCQSTTLGEGSQGAPQLPAVLSAARGAGRSFCEKMCFADSSESARGVRGYGGCPERGQSGVDDEGRRRPQIGWAEHRGDQT